MTEDASNQAAEQVDALPAQSARLSERLRRAEAACRAARDWREAPTTAALLTWATLLGEWEALG